MPSVPHQAVVDLLRAGRAQEPPEGLPLEQSRANMGLLAVWPIFPGVPESDAAVAQFGEWVRKRTGA